TVVPSFAVSVSPTSVSVSRGSSGTSKVTTTVAGGFSGPVRLTASGQPSGVTVSFSPSAIAAPGAGTSTVKFTVSGNARTGTRNITIKAANGSTSHTTTVSLTIK